MKLRIALVTFVILGVCSGVFHAVGEGKSDS
jgi:hypothetical protein